MWRRHVIAAAETLSDTEVWEYSLPTSGILNAVLLHIENVNGGTDNLINPIYKNINSVQLVDGGRVLLDVSGVQAQALSLFGTRGEPRSKVREAPGETQTYQALLMFGLKLWDNEVGLDLATLKNPKLRVDIDFTKVRAVGATGFLAGSGSMSGIVFINDGADQPSPGNFIKSHEIKQWTTAASGDETTQAPMDGPWARLIVRAHVAGSCPDDVLTDIKVAFDAGQFVPLDEKTKWEAHGLPLILGRYPRFEFNLFRKDNETIDLEHGSIQVYTAGTIDAEELTSLSSIGCGNVVLTTNKTSDGSSATVDSNRSINIWPIHPYMCMFFDFVPMGMLNVEPFDRGDIVLTQAVASAAASLVLQQLMPNRSVS